MEDNHKNFCLRTIHIIKTVHTANIKHKQYSKSVFLGPPVNKAILQEKQKEKRQEVFDNKAFEKEKDLDDEKVFTTAI